MYFVLNTMPKTLIEMYAILNRSQGQTLDGICLFFPKMCICVLTTWSLSQTESSDLLTVVSEKNKIVNSTYNIYYITYK